MGVRRNPATCRLITMAFDTYTQSIPLTQKATFWTNYIGALKGSHPLRAREDVDSRICYPSITETVPEFRDLQKEFGKIEDQMLSRRHASTPLTPVLPNAHDRYLFTLMLNIIIYLFIIEYFLSVTHMSQFILISMGHSTQELPASPKHIHWSILSSKMKYVFNFFSLRCRIIAVNFL